MLPDLPRDTRFTTFLQAFRRHWGVLVTGIASIPFTFLWLYVSNEAAKIAFGLLAVGCVFMASYFVWRDQRRDYLAEYDRNGKPEIKCTIRAGYINQVPVRQDEDRKIIIPNEAIIVLETVLENLRQVPTIIRDKTLTFTDENGEKYPGRWVEFVYAPYIHKELTPGEWTNRFEYPIETAITPEKPLEYGKPKVCWIRFFMPDVIARDHSSVRVELCLQDGIGVWWPFKTLMPFKFGEMLENTGKLAINL